MKLIVSRSSTSISFLFFTSSIFSVFSNSLQDQKSFKEGFSCNFVLVHFQMTLKQHVSSIIAPMIDSFSCTMGHHTTPSICCFCGRPTHYTCYIMHWNHFAAVFTISLCSSSQLDPNNSTSMLVLHKLKLSESV